MGQWEWRAWVETADGVRSGAAFLVTPRKLLTCAHVVRGRESARVGLPGLPAPLPVRVHRCSDWAGQNDLGDVAVLELPHEVGLRPAELAAPDALLDPGLWRGELRAYGFPYRSDQEMRFVTVRTSSDMAQRDEWWHVHVQHGDRLEAGYSGSAVYDPYSGRVVGMVTDSDPDDPDDDSGRGVAGRMLPIGTLRRYWEELDDHLPLTWLNAAARRELRLTLDGLPADRAAVARVLDLPPARPLRSAWDAARYIAEGFDEERLARYLTALLPSVPRLAGWRRRHLPAPETAGRRAEPASIIVRLERMTHGHDVTVQTWIDGAPGPAGDTVRVAAERDVRRAVERSVEAIGPVVDDRPDLDWMIEFAVPANWLGKPFEEWYLNRDRRLRMRHYPVVVRDVTRLRPEPFLRDQARRRWKRLRDPGNPHPVECRPPAPNAFRDLLEAHDHLGLLVYGSPPGRAHLKAALDLAVPVMLWPRGRCADADHADCAGRRTRRTLAGHVAGVDPGGLPGVVYRLRREALRQKALGRGPHCGDALTLLWDDPSRLPDPPLAMEV
ncbi:trypsin-like peptidase domain-containing protein [Actinomadura kijaniata]|uniref:VMAP-C domain-containing protein n=1 Tax=Actinomadura kijaniata TaxID=46161 RepID=UPI003F1D67AE